MAMCPLANIRHLISICAIAANVNFNVLAQTLCQIPPLLHFVFKYTYTL